MFSVRTKSGFTFTNTEWNDDNGKELEYKTRAEAEKQIDAYKRLMPDQEFYVHEVKRDTDGPCHS